MRQSLFLRRNMVSLKTKNPFTSGVELVSWTTAIGVGAFAVLAGVTIVAIKGVVSRAEKVSNPVDAAWEKLRGLG